MFQGVSQLTLDGKGRLSMPTRHRDVLAAQCEGRLTLTRHPDGCVLFYPRPTWEAKRPEIAALPYSARALQRILLGNAIDTEVDASGRVLVPAELRTPCSINRDVMLLGMGNHFELWDVKRLGAHEKEQLANGLPDAAAHFTF